MDARRTMRHRPVTVTYIALAVIGWVIVGGLHLAGLL